MLAPRLPGFRAAHPGVALTLSTRLRPFDLEAEGFDAAIHYGRPDWPGADHLLLMEEEVIPVAAPHLLPDGVVEAEAGHPERARATWRALLADSPPDAPWRARVERRLGALP